MKTRFAYSALVACSAALIACNGWPRPLELNTAKRKAEKYPTYAALPAQQNQVFSFDNRRFMVTPATVDLHAVKLQQVGTAGNVAIYTPQGEQSPYTSLFASAGGTLYHRVVPLE